MIQAEDVHNTLLAQDFSGSDFSFDSFGGLGGSSSSSSKGGMSGGAITGLIGTGLKAYGQYKEGQDIAGAYEYNAALTLQGLDFDISRIDVAEKELSGTQAAMFAKAGVTMSGSPLDVMLKSATNFELDKQIASYNAHSQATMDEYKASKAKEQASFNSTSTLITGALQAAETIGMFAFL